MTKDVKVVLIGSGNVGSSFLYAAINQGLSRSYGIIDVNSTLRDAQVLDFEDSAWNNPVDFKIHAANYADLKNTEYLVITAGLPQKAGQTRLELAGANVKIMKEIATQVKESGFSGYTIIASNPLDVMTYTYLKTTGFPKNKVIGSGTTLDTARLRSFISRRMNVSNNSVQAFILGEHGDSSVTLFSQIKIDGISFKNFENIHGINENNYETLLETPVRQKAYEIIKGKGATYYGIGSALAYILKALINGTDEILPVCAYLDGEYGVHDVCVGVPSIVGKDGIAKVIEYPMNDKELKKFHASVDIIKKYNQEHV